MGGGSIIIIQAEILRNAIQDPAFYDQMGGMQKKEASTLISRPLAEWTSANLRFAAVLLMLSTIEHGGIVESQIIENTAKEQQEPAKD